MSEKPPQNDNELNPPERGSGYDMSAMDSMERGAAIERAVQEGDEQWASEALQLDQPLSPEEQQQLVDLISDPLLSFETLTLTSVTGGKELTPDQAEKLMGQIESDIEAVRYFHMQLVESGLTPEEMTETERQWFERLEAALEKGESGDI